MRLLPSISRSLLIVLFALPASAQDAPAQTPPAKTPSPAAAHNAAGAALYDKGDYEGALVRLRQAYNLAPEQMQIRRNLTYCLLRVGDALLLKGDTTAALRDYGEAGSLLPKAWAPRFREGLALYRARRDREAITLLRRALVEHPKRGEGWELLALAQYRASETAAAIKSWESALRLDPQNERIKRDLARARRDESVEGQLFLDQSTPHFAIKYDGTHDRSLGRTIGELLEEAYKVVGGLIGRYPRHEIGVVVYPGRTFRAATGAHAWVGALYNGKIRLPAGGLTPEKLPQLRQTLRHEYTHALLHALGKGRVPTWLNEGAAQLAEGKTLPPALKTLGPGARPSLKELSVAYSSIKDATRVRRLYAGALALTHHLVGTHGWPALAAIVDALGQGKSLEAAFQAAISQSPSELHAAWARAR